MLKLTQRQLNIAIKFPDGLLDRVNSRDGVLAIKHRQSLWDFLIKKIK